MDGWIKGWMDGIKDGWMEKRMDGWPKGWMDGWTHMHTNMLKYVQSHIEFVK